MSDVVIWKRSDNPNTPRVDEAALDESKAQYAELAEKLKAALAGLPEEHRKAVLEALRTAREASDPQARALEQERRERSRADGAATMHAAEQELRETAKRLQVLDQSLSESAAVLKAAEARPDLYTRARAESAAPAPAPKPRAVDVAKTYAATAAHGRLIAIAKNLCDANPALSEAEAMVAACESNPDLYAAAQSAW